MDFYSKRRSRSRVSSLTTGVVAIFNQDTSVAKAAVLIMNISRKEHYQPHILFTRHKQANLQNHLHSCNS